MLNNSNGGYNNNYNNGGFNNNNSSGEEKQKSNFRYGKFRSTDGIMEVGIWVNQYGITGKLLIRQAVGKDPSTNAPIYENKPPMDLPQALLDREKMALIIKLIEDGKYAKADFVLNNAGSNTVTFATEGNNVKITLTSNKTNENRSITFEGFNNNGNVFNAQLYTLSKWLKIAYNKALTLRVEDDNSLTDEETPF